MIRLLIILIFSIITFSEEKIIHIPTNTTVALVLANNSGLINGTHNVRARLYNPDTKERLWVEDFYNIPIKNGAFTLTMNSIPNINPYDLHQKNIIFVVTVNDQTVEIPLLTDFYAYRSLFAEYGWDTRFPDVFFIDRENGYLGFGNTSPKTHIDVNGAIKVGYEITSVNGVIRWNPYTLPEPIIEVRHADEWISLLYAPGTFKPSRWTDHSKSISLSSPNYKIGIGTNSPQKQLHVEGSAYFSKDLTATSANVGHLVVNSVTLNNTNLSATGIYVNHNQKNIQWTQENMFVTYGTIKGNGNNLNNIGRLNIYATNLIQANHLGTPAISSRNIKIQAIYENHLIPLSISSKNLSPKIFTSDHFSDESIGSINIQAFSLSHLTLESEGIIDYIPNRFFTKNKIATNNIFLHHIQDETITSQNISNNALTSQHIKSNIITQEVIQPNTLTPDLFSAGAIQISLFGGPLPTANGGTGLTQSQPNKILSIGESTYNMSFPFYFNGQSACLPYEICNTNHGLSINPDSGASSISIEQTQNQDTSIKLTNSIGGAQLKLHQNGILNLLSGTQSLFMSYNNNLSLVNISPSVIDPTIYQEQLDIGSAITIGNSANGQPNAGTIEFDDINNQFRFYNGTDWLIAQNTGHGIGSPILVGKNNIQSIDTFIGTIENSSIHTSHSFITNIKSSSLKGNNLDTYHLESSFINGNNSKLSYNSLSTIINKNSSSHQVKLSDLTINNSLLSFVSSSKINGNSLYGTHIENTSILADNSHIQQSNSSTLNLVKTSATHIDNTNASTHVSKLNTVKNSTIHGKQLTISTLFDSDINGNSNQLMSGNDIILSGNNNALINNKQNTIFGNNNFSINSNSLSMTGNNNRNFGWYNNIFGDNNTIFGNQINLDGNNNIVFNASSTTLNLTDNSNIVFYAPNGVFISTGPDMVVAASEAAGGWTMVSDKNLKFNFMDVNHKSIFNKLINLPIHKWEYIFHKGIKHIGPMAQDFKHLFDLGEDERFITASDTDGVAFSAIKYLIEEIDSLETKKHPISNLKINAILNKLNQIEYQISRQEKNIELKKSALEKVFDDNFKQYKIIDKQFKELSNINIFDAEKKTHKIIVILIIILMFNILFGFFASKTYYKIKDREKI